MEVNIAELKTGQFQSRCVHVNNVLIRPPLYNNVTTVAGYYYNYSTKQHVSALLGHHQAYTTVELVKVHSVVLPMGSHGLQYCYHHSRISDNV